jgi:CDGSH-type Zn-finger protein
MTTIKVIDNGPLVVEGDIQLNDGTGAQWDLGGRAKISLCRCGQSMNKPFCDGGHKKLPFQSQCKAAVLPPPAPPTPKA